VFSPAAGQKSAPSDIDLGFEDPLITVDLDQERSHDRAEQIGTSGSGRIKQSDSLWAHWAVHGFKSRRLTVDRACSWWSNELDGYATAQRSPYR